MNPNSKVPEEVMNRMDLIDVLECYRYFDEDYYSEMNVVLNIDKETSLAGGVVNEESSKYKWYWSRINIEECIL